MGKSENLQKLQNIFDTRVNILPMAKLKSEFYTSITPKGFSVMIVLTES